MNWLFMNIMSLTAQAQDLDAAAAETQKLNELISQFGIPEYMLTGVGLIIISAVFIVPLFLAAIPANIAKKKGRMFSGYYVFGYFALIPAIIVTLVQKDISKDEPEKKMSDVINNWGHKK